MAKAKRMAKCPSCEAEVFAGKFCVDCGAELTSEEEARFSDDVLDSLADRVAKKLESRLKRAEEPPTDDDEKQGGDDAKAKTRFFKK